jgi:2'-5' RNA ligase
MNTKNGSITNIFLAVEFDDDTRQLLARKLYLLDYKDYLRLESKRNLHITLGYIRDVHETQRREIINAFKPLKECTPFSAHVEAPIVLGAFQHMLCVQLAPYEAFFQLHEQAKELLSSHTEFRLDEKHPDFIPHAKLQTIRKSSGTEMHNIIIEEFESLNFRKLDFKVKTLALMHRIDKEYHTLYRYDLIRHHVPNEKEEPDSLLGVMLPE